MLAEENQVSFLPDFFICGSYLSKGIVRLCLMIGKSAFVYLVSVEVKAATDENRHMTP